VRSLIAEAKYRGELNNLKAEVVRMHQAGFGLKRIAAKTGVPKTTARRWLKEAGIYDPPEKSAKPAGEGAASRYAILSKSQVRKEREAKIRKMMAVCLRELWRSGVAIETTCRVNGWPHNAIWNHLFKRSSYRKLRKKLRRDLRWGGEMDKARSRGVTSKTYLTETAFQGAIEALLSQSGILFKREAKLPGCRTRVDFLAGDLYIECKVSCRAGQVYESMGQLLHYSELSKVKPVLLLPDDVTMRADLAKIITERIPALILRESQFLGFLNGQPTAALNSLRPAGLLSRDEVKV
jgi:hypothetical protein